MALADPVEEAQASNVDVMSLLTQGLVDDKNSRAGATAPPPQGDPEDLSGDGDEEYTPEDDAEDTDPEPSTDEGQQEPQSLPEPPLGGADPEAVARWADRLVSKPQSWVNIPAQHRTHAIAAMANSIREQTASEIVEMARQGYIDVQNSAYQAGLAAGRQSMQQAAEEGELEALANQDPQELARLVLEEPEKVARFAQRKAVEKSGANNTLVQFQRHLDVVKDDPYAVQVLKQKQDAEPGRYDVRNPNVLKNIEADVIEARVASGIARERASAQQPPSEAQAREQAATKRRSVPVTAPGPGGSGAAPTDAPLPSDRNALFGLALKQEATARRRS